MLFFIWLAIKVIYVNHLSLYQTLYMQYACNHSRVGWGREGELLPEIRTVLLYNSVAIVTAPLPHICSIVNMQTINLVALSWDRLNWPGRGYSGPS